MSSNQKNEYLYHYTSIENLKNIIESNELWFTNIEYLNDSSEFNYARSFYQNYIKNKQTLAKISRHFEEYPDNYAAAAVAILEKIINKVKSLHYASFIFCFSEKGDDLSQWRGYTRYGKGVCVAFKREQLGSAISKDKASLIKERQCLDRRVDRYLHECIYSKVEQEGCVLGSLIEIFANNVINADNPNWGSVEPFDIWLECLSLKHPAYSGEKEWRAIKLLGPDNTIHYKNGNNNLIPVLKEKFQNVTEFIDHVIVGPNPNKMLAKKSIENFLSGSRISVKSSNIPYREL